MKSEKQKIKSTAKGITLIALVITIIVLLILAGITINLTIGQDGILKRAQDAGKNYTNAAEYEKTQLAEFTNTADKIIEGLTSKTLVSQIKPADYGKSINYSVTVKNADDEDVTLTDWKVFYNDGTNVYIILGDYLNNTLIDTTKLNIKTENTYTVYWDEESGANNAEVAQMLKNTENWSEFATGKGAKSATGSPTAEMLMLSHNAKYKTTFEYTDPATLRGSLWDEYLYVPYNGAIDGCNGYWTTTIDATSDVNIFRVGSSGTYCASSIRYYMYGLRPVVCLQTGITGAVGDTVTID